MMKTAMLPLEEALKEAIKDTDFAWVPTPRSNRVKIYDTPELKLIYNTPVNCPIDETIKLEMATSVMGRSCEIYALGAQVLLSPPNYFGDMILLMEHKNPHKINPKGKQKRPIEIMDRISQYVNDDMNFVRKYHRKPTTPALITDLANDIVTITNYARALR